MEQLGGRFHAHITYECGVSDRKAYIPGWKQTIIVLKKGATEQNDVMITRHFFIPSEKYPDLEAVYQDIKLASRGIHAQGYKVTRWKLEHESLPTVAPSNRTYREAHIKIKKPLGVKLIFADPYVQSRNPMESYHDHEVVFLNARFRSGDVEDIDLQVKYQVRVIQDFNPTCEVLEVKLESTVFDTNQELDRWWA